MTDLVRVKMMDRQGEGVKMMDLVRVKGMKMMDLARVTGVTMTSLVRVKG